MTDAEPFKGEEGDGFSLRDDEIQMTIGWEFD